MTAQRALPGWAIDAITEGVPNRDRMHPADARSAEWSILVRTARAAQRAWWTRDQWASLILNDKRVRRRLGEQLRWRSDKRAQSEQAVVRRLSKAWDRAANMPYGSWDREGAVAGLLAACVDAVEDNEADLSEGERAILAAFAAQAQQMRMTRVAFPWRTAQGLSGLSEWATKRALADLRRKGWLRLRSRGQWRGEGQPGIANIYEAGPTLNARPSHRPRT